MNEYEVKFVFKRHIDHLGETIKTCVLADNIGDAIGQAYSIFEKQLEGQDVTSLFFLSIEEIHNDS